MVSVLVSYLDQAVSNDLVHCALLLLTAFLLSHQSKFFLANYYGSSTICWWRLHPMIDQHLGEVLGYIMAVNK